MKKVILLLWAVSALVGCSKHEQPVNGNPNLAVELSGSLNNAGVTRSDGVIGGDAPSKELTIDVLRTDMVSSSYPDAEWDLKVEGTLGTDKSVTLAPTQYFLDDATQSSRFIGVYPKGDAYDKSARTITYTELDGAMDVAVSDFAEGHSSDQPNTAPVYTSQTLLFSHLLTKIAVKLQAKDDDPGKVTEIINLWGEIEKIEVVGKKTGAVVTLPDANATDATGVSIVADGTPADLPLTSMDGDVPDAKLLTGTADIFGYAMFLPVESEGTLTLKIHLKNTGSINGVQTVTTTTAQLYEAGKGHTITVIFGTTPTLSIAVAALEGEFNLWDDVDVEIEEDGEVLAITPQATTAAADKMTNAYIVAPESVLRFKVARAYKYEGTAFTGDLRATNAAYAGAFTAEVLWSDAAVIDGDVAVVGSGADAVVSLKTTATPGNAVVAIKDSSNNIVWSYHIWVTDYDPETENTTSAKSSLTFMSRNLGALANDLSTNAYGLFYQWGRKDPFTGPGGVDNAITKEATDATKGTIEYTIQHPSVFYYGVSGSSYDWLYAARQDDLWGQGADKSVYDPCPSGWRVPQFTTLDVAGSPWSGFTKDNGAWSDSGGKGWDWSNATYNNGEATVPLFTPQSFAVYPAAGTRSDTYGEFEYTSSRVCAWSSAVTGVKGYYLFFDVLGGTPSNTNNRANGFSVRCVQE